MPYRVGKPIDSLFYDEYKEHIEKGAYIEFDSKMQFELMAMQSDSYKRLKAKYDTLFDYWEKLFSISETVRHIIITDGKIDRQYDRNNEDEAENDS